MTALEECIASGQVSAAQVVAHRDAGELAGMPMKDVDRCQCGYQQPCRNKVPATFCRAALDAKKESI
jgi:hypothetical protein